MAPSSATVRLAEAPPGRDELYGRFSPYVARLAFRLLGRDGELEDLVQDTFLEAFKSMPELPEVHQVRRWLATVAVRLAGRKLRRRRLASFFGLDDGAHQQHLLARDASPEVRAMVTQLYEGLERLPVKQRVAWTLRHVEGEPLEAVARLCDCSLATAKRQIAAASQALGGGTDEA